LNGDIAEALSDLELKIISGTIKFRYPRMSFTAYDIAIQIAVLPVSFKALTRNDRIYAALNSVLKNYQFSRLRLVKPACCCVSALIAQRPQKSLLSDTHLTRFEVVTYVL